MHLSMETPTPFPYHLGETWGIRQLKGKKEEKAPPYGGKFFDDWMQETTQRIIKLKVLKLQSKALTLVNIRNNVNKTSKTFRPNNFGLRRFLKSQMSDGCLMVYNSASTTPAKNITNDSCAWLRKWFANVGNVNMIVSRVAVSLRIPGLKKKSPVKITSLIYNSHVKSIPCTNWFAQYARRRFGYPVSIRIDFRRLYFSVYS